MIDPQDVLRTETAGLPQVSRSGGARLRDGERQHNQSGMMSSFSVACAPEPAK